MKTFDFTLTIAGESVDTEVVKELVREAIEEGFPSGTLFTCKYGGSKSYSEQGWKVARSRKFGISVEAAGDSNNAKLTKEVLEPVA